MNSSTKFQYKCLAFLAIFYSVFTIMTLLSENKLEILGSILTYNFLCSFSYIFKDIIAELYGYKMAMRFFWGEFSIRILFIVLFLFSFVSSQFLGQENYVAMFQNIWKIFLINPILLLIVIRVNLELFGRWRILWCGKYFILRSILSSGIAEVLFILLVISFRDIISGRFSFHDIMYSTFYSGFFRVMFTAILSLPALYIVNILKIVEGVSARELGKDIFFPASKDGSL